MDWSGYLAQQGRGNDTLVAHITPEEAILLKAHGGSGTINPHTGLLEFWDDGGNDPGGEGGTTGSTGYGGSGGEPGRGGVGDDPAAGNYGGWGDPGSAFGDTSLGNAEPGIWDRIAGWFEDLSLMDVVKGVMRAGQIGANLASGNIPGVMAGIFTGLTGIPSNPVSGMLGVMGREISGATMKGAIEANQEAFEGMTQASLAGKTGAGWGGGFDVSSTALGETMQEKEKVLDKLFTQYGEVGDYAGAVQAARTFEQKATIKTMLESEINRYSEDPLYKAIEPEFRVVADAAQEKGMEPKMAVEYAYAKVTEAYNARKYIREFLDRKRKELEATA